MARIVDTAPDVPTSGRKPRASKAGAIEVALRNAIAMERIGPGVTLTERALCEVFDASRTPVRSALKSLVEDGVVVAFQGGGFGLPGFEPNGLIADASMLLSGSDRSQTGRSSDSIEREFEEALIDALPFGQFWIAEQAAADHFGVSRTVVRELLTRMEMRMLVRKDDRSHWVVGPLTAVQVQHHYELRGALEPLALRQSAPLIPPQKVADMMRSIDSASCENPPTVAEMMEIENDLHVRLLSHAPNSILRDALRHAQIPLSVTRLFMKSVGTASSVPLLAEHRIVLDLVLRGAIDAACEALGAHIGFSAERMRQRLKTFSVFPNPAQPAFLNERPAAVVS